MALPSLLTMISITPHPSPVEKGESQRQKILIHLDDQSILQGELLALEHTGRKTKVIILGNYEDQAKRLDIPFTKLLAIYYLHEFDQQQATLPSIGQDFWSRIAAQDISGTITITENDGKYFFNFDESQIDLGGIFVIPPDKSRFYKIFIPFPFHKQYNSKTQLGQTMLQQGFINQDELMRGLSKQSDLRRKRIGEVLIEDAIASPEEVENGLKKQKVKLESKLGEILVAAGTVSQSQVHEALNRQKQDAAKRLGQIFLEMGIVNEEMLTLAIALKFGLPYVELTDHPIDRAALECIPKEMAKKLKIFPLKVKNNQLTVVFSDPTALETKQDLTSKYMTII